MDHFLALTGEPLLSSGPPNEANVRVFSSRETSRGCLENCLLGQPNFEVRSEFVKERCQCALNTPNNMFFVGEVWFCGRVR